MKKTLIILAFILAFVSFIKAQDFEKTPWAYFQRLMVSKATRQLIIDNIPKIQGKGMDFARSYEIEEDSVDHLTLMIRKVNTYVVELRIRYNFKNGVVNSIDFDTYSLGYLGSGLRLNKLGYTPIENIGDDKCYKNNSNNLIATYRDNPKKFSLRCTMKFSE